MTVTAPDITARVLGSPDVPVSIRAEGEIVLDVARAPHVQGTGLRLAMSEPSLLEDLDPRDGRRLVITVAGRDFDLGIRRVRNSGEGVAAVEVASDEALLEDFAQLTDDLTPHTLQSSLRGVVGYVLGKIGAVLEPGGPDADVTAYWAVTNLLANPSLEVDAGNWRAVGGSTSLTRIQMSNPVAPAGDYALRFAANRSGTAMVAPVAELDDFTVTPGRWYVFAFKIASQVTRSARAILQWRNANGTVVVSETAGAAISSVNSQFRRAYVIGRAPAGATHALPYVETAGNVSGNLHYVDEGMFYEGDLLTGYFDGATAPAGYTTAWQGASHKSASERTPLVERPAEALTWRAGVSGLEFLRSLLLAAGLRLVCDERRRWTLRDADHVIAGQQTFRVGVNITASDDEITRDGEQWRDGAVIRYRWTDRDGIEQTRDDTYALTGTPTKVLLREVNAPYPGPGRAQYAVQRAQGTGRTVTGTRQATWAEHAEQSFSAILDDAVTLVGRAERVAFDLAQNTVTTTSRTVDTPAGAIDLLPGTINALPGSINTL